MLRGATLAKTMGCMGMADRARPVARARRLAVVGVLAALAVVGAWRGAVSPSLASARAPLSLIHFRGAQVRAPASWPVYRLSAHPGMCVRLDRRAVYLGTPGARQRCPANAIGRRRAIVLDPGAARLAARSSALATTPRALPRASSAAGSFTGLGFDACSTPSPQTMSAWSSSPYRALGIYIGGVNRACTQPNLTSAWVTAEVGAGWHPIPLYVGLQAPTSSCSGCAKLSSNQASAQGTAAANDAVEEAARVNIGAGSPIYFDMEGYTPGSSATRATLTFLSAWTSRLHVLGYVSGVYSSSASGIADLASEVDTGYLEPNDLWTANWNGEDNSADPYLSSSDWASHQRIHQYRGANNETYGRVTMNIDNDYVEGATVGAASSAPPPSPPLTISSVEAAGGAVSVGLRCGRPSGETCPGQILMRSEVRVRLGGRGAGSRMTRIAIARRGFILAGGRSHTFRVVLNARGRPLLRKSGTLQTQLVVAIPGSRASRAVVLRQGTSGSGGL
jgi:hypothetical protein